MDEVAIEELLLNQLAQLPSAESRAVAPNQLADLERWEHDIGFTLPVEVRHTMLRFGGMSFGEGERPYLTPGSRGSFFFARARVEQVFRVTPGTQLSIARGKILDDFLFAREEQGLESGNDWPSFLVPIVGDVARGLFCLDFLFSDDAPPLVFVDGSSEWDGDENTFSAVSYVSPTLTDFVHGIEYPTEETGDFATEVGSLGTPTGDQLRWIEHRNKVLTFGGPRLGENL